MNGASRPVGRPEHITTTQGNPSRGHPGHVLGVETPAHRDQHDGPQSTSSARPSGHHVVLDAALEYARRGWHVFPCKGKQPLTPNGFHNGSSKLDQVEKWFKADVNIGIRTGRESRLVVLDIDLEKGGDHALADLEREHGQLPDTVEVLTGGGGRHIYFSHPGIEVRCSAGRLGPGLDIRADGGYVIAPPSLHDSGHRYGWEVSSHPDDVAPRTPAGGRERSP
jgi:Bifunctional DNA primase/polymerase, N-terminal